MIVIYSKQGCSSCIATKQFCESNNLEYQYKMLNKYFTLSEFYEVAPKSHKTFPMITKDGSYIGSFNELKEIINNNSN